MRQALLAGALALAPLCAQAEVKSATPESMLIEHRFTVAGAPADQKPWTDATALPVGPAGPTMLGPLPLPPAPPAPPEPEVNVMDDPNPNEVSSSTPTEME